MDTQSIDAILEIDPALTQNATCVTAELVVAQTVPTAIVVSDPARDAERLEDDFTFARDKMRDLIKKGREACDSAILLAQSGDNHNAYRVVGEMITSIVNANKELVALHKGKLNATPDISGGSSVDGGASVNIEKAVFVGRAQDLLREIRAITAPKGSE